MRLASITVDLEKDWGGKSNTCFGVREGLPQILQILEENKVYATFFVNGEIIEQNEDCLKQLVENRHEIASHGFHHVEYKNLSKKEMMSEIKMSKDKIRKHLNCKPIGFRSPRLTFNPHLFKILSKLRFKYDSSSVDSFLPFRFNAKSDSPYIAEHGIIEIPVSSFTMFKIPFGLLWMNTFGVGEIPKKPTLIFYMHAFDILSSKPEFTIGLVRKIWYRPRDSLSTFKKFLFKAKKEFNFTTLKEISERYG
jgi:peptidoglycan/xylan/chitin deacetylase (PgdA/CDA1 family)